MENISEIDGARLQNIDLIEDLDTGIVRSIRSLWKAGLITHAVGEELVAEIHEYGRRLYLAGEDVALMSAEHGVRTGVPLTDGLPEQDLFESQVSF